MKVAQQRKTEILSLLKNNGEMTVNELAERFDVSSLTIRRDLEQLETEGVQRYHGGAKINTSKILSSSERSRLAIAKVAAEYVHSDDIVFINSSQTALLALAQVTDTQLTAITNNGKALSIPIDPRIHLVLCGGNISFPKEALTGEFALNNLEKMTATRSILGISGISFDMGLTTPNLAEVAVNKSMLKRTQGEKIIVADSTKLNHNSAFSSGELSTIDILITDKGADLNFVKKLRDLGIEVVLVDV